MKSLFNIFNKQPWNILPVQFHTSNDNKLKMGTIRQTVINNYRTMRCRMNIHSLYRL